MAEAELRTRQDVLSWDALAWSQFAAGQVTQARETMVRALAEGTRDGRLFLHAAVIATTAADPETARGFVQQAAALKAMLLPSERRLLGELIAAGGRHAGR